MAICNESLGATRKCTNDWMPADGLKAHSLQPNHLGFHFYQYSGSVCEHITVNCSTNPTGRDRLPAKIVTQVKTEFNGLSKSKEARLVLLQPSPTGHLIISHSLSLPHWSSWRMGREVFGVTHKDKHDRLLFSLVRAANISWPAEGCGDPTWWGVARPMGDLMTGTLQRERGCGLKESKETPPAMTWWVMQYGYGYIVFILLTKVVQVFYTFSVWGLFICLSQDFLLSSLLPLLSYQVCPPTVPREPVSPKPNTWANLRSGTLGNFSIRGRPLWNVSLLTWKVISFPFVVFLPLHKSSAGALLSTAIAQNKSTYSQSSLTKSTPIWEQPVTSLV